jgi:hypothetical protein
MANDHKANLFVITSSPFGSGKRICVLQHVSAAADAQRRLACTSDDPTCQCFSR